MQRSGIVLAIGHQRRYICPLPTNFLILLNIYKAYKKMAIDVCVHEISTAKYRIYRHVIKDQIHLNSLCTIPELSYLTVPDVPGSNKCRRFKI